MHDAAKRDLLAALREQVSESHHHRGTPGYSNHDLVENARMFDTVADWIDDNWDAIFPEQATPCTYTSRTLLGGVLAMVAHRNDVAPQDVGGYERMLLTHALDAMGFVGEPT